MNPVGVGGFKGFVSVQGGKLAEPKPSCHFRSGGRKQPGKPTDTHRDKRERTVAGPSRRTADPLARLHARQLLDVSDGRLNDILHDAGLRYRALVTAAELPGPAAADMGRVVVDGGRGSTGVDRSAAARAALRAAEAAVGARCLPILRGVVVEERPVAELRGLVQEVRDRASADAVALDRLRDGLHRLAERWGMLKVNVSSPLQTWHSIDLPRARM